MTTKQQNEPGRVGTLVGQGMAIVIALCIAAILIACVIWLVARILPFCIG